MTDNGPDDEIGYRKPPKNTRFKRGVSGNPSGRPKRGRSFKADLAAELQETIVLIDEITKSSADALLACSGAEINPRTACPSISRG